MCRSLRSGVHSTANQMPYHLVHLYLDDGEYTHAFTHKHARTHTHVHRSRNRRLFLAPPSPSPLSLVVITLRVIIATAQPTLLHTPSRSTSTKSHLAVQVVALGTVFQVLAAGSDRLLEQKVLPLRHPGDHQRLQEKIFQVLSHAHPPSTLPPLVSTPGSLPAPTRRHSVYFATN